MPTEVVPFVSVNPLGPTILTASPLPNGAIGVGYLQVFVTTGTAPFVYSILSGALPPGLVFNAGVPSVSGIPTASGIYTFVFQVQDATARTASATFTITIPVVVTSPSIANSSLPNGTVGVPYNASVLGQGGQAPYTFEVIGGGLPAGLTLASTGGITGTPTVAVTVSALIQITDSSLPQGTGSSTLSITIVAANITNPITTIDETVLVAGVDGALYVVVPGQRHDQDYDGKPVAWLQKWYGVPGPSGGLALMQLGGASISAKGNGNLNVVAIDDDGNSTNLTTTARPITLSLVETKRDLIAKAVPHSERYGIGFDNQGTIYNTDGSTSFGPVADAWFELHVAILWVRQFFSSRKA